MSHVAFPYVLAIFTFCVFHYVGIRKKGLGKYLKEIAFMPGVPKPVYILLTPIEIATFFLVRPLTLSLTSIRKYVRWPLVVAGLHHGWRLHASR